MDYRVFDPLLDAVCVVDAERTLVYANEALANLCGTSVKRLKLGASILQSFSLEEQDHWLMSREAWREGDAGSYQEVAFKAARGRSGRVQLSIAPDPNAAPEAPRWIAILRDVTLEESLQRKYRSELEMKERAFRELEDINKNLEQKVEARTHEVRQANRTIASMVDSLGQGFLIFESDGRCRSVYSKACERLLEGTPSRQFIGDVLRVPAAKRPGFDKWVAAVFTEILPAEDLLALGPKEFPHSEGLYVSLDYRAVRSEAGKVEGVVVVATDRTAEREAEQEASRERAQAKLVTQIARSRNQFHAFLRELKQLVGELRSETAKGEAAFGDLAGWFRKLHTLKGDAGSFALQDVESVAHAFEDELAVLRSGGSGAGSVRQARDRMLLRAQELEQAFESFLSENADVVGKGWDRSDRVLEIPASQFQAMARTLQSDPAAWSIGGKFVIQFLEEPLERLFSHFGGVVSNLAHQLRKEVRPLRFVGGDLRIRTEAIQGLLPPLVHAFRNAVDHGIELPEEREAMGKPRAGTIEVRFEAISTGSLRILITDDGKGIDPAAIRRKLEKDGKGSLARAETDEQVIQHVFDAGLSTRESVNETSGRGIGMDAIQSAAQTIGGRAWVRSQWGQGTTLCLELPIASLSPEGSI